MALAKVITFDWQAVGEGGFAVTNTCVFDTSVVRSGTASMMVAYGDDFFNNFTVPLDTALSELYLQFGLYSVAGTQSYARSMLAWKKGTTVLGGLKLNTANKLEIWLGNFTTKVAESSASIPAGQWVVVEVYVKIADTDGVITLRQDTIQVATYSGDTQPGTDTSVDTLMFGSAANGSLYYDDIVIHDTSGTSNNSWPGGVKCILLLPNGDGSTLQWTPTPSGTHYTTVDDAPPSGTDYLQAGSTGLVDELNFADLPAAAATVRAVVAQAWALKKSTSSPTTLALGLKIGGTNYYSPNKTLGTSQTFVQHIWNDNPAGGSFTVSVVNAAQLALQSGA